MRPHAVASIRRLVASIAAVTTLVLAGAGCGSSSGESEDHDAGTEPDGGTGGDAASGAAALISNSSWSKTTADDDPLASHRPDSVECPDSATGQEELNGDESFSVKTSACNYYSGSQPSLGAVEKGDPIEARIWHFELTSNEPTKAHLAIVLDGDVAWETEVDIPAEQGELLNPTWTAQSDYPAGTTVTFHLHNHGANQWNFIEMSNQSDSK